MSRKPDPTELSHEDYQNALSHENETDDSELFDNTDYDPLDDGILADNDEEVEPLDAYNEDIFDEDFGQDDLDSFDQDSTEDSFDDSMDEE